MPPAIGRIPSSLPGGMPGLAGIGPYGLAAMNPAIKNPLNGLPIPIPNIPGFNPQSSLAQLNLPRPNIQVRMNWFFFINLVNLCLYFYAKIKNLFVQPSNISNYYSERFQNPHWQLAAIFNFFSSKLSQINPFKNCVSLIISFIIWTYFIQLKSYTVGAVDLRENRTKPDWTHFCWF